MWRWLRERGPAKVLAVAGAVVVTVGVAPAWGSFIRIASVSHVVTTGTLQPPASLAAAHSQCTKNRSDSVALTWAATTSAFATGYEILRDDGAGGPLDVIGTVGGASATSYVDGMVGFSTTYTYAVRAVRNFWRSAASAPVSIATLGKNCK
jgi:hypothetical protein